MDYESRLSISYYREIAAINQEHHIFLVQHIKSKKIFIKKNLDIYHLDIYQKLKESPIRGIPRIYELYEEDGRLTVIEEYISGTTLEELIQTHGSLIEKKAVTYILQLCDILSILHHSTPVIVHRDIKPSNIMITSFEHVVLLDFNAAKYMDTSKNMDTILLGTHGYAAPEQYGFGSSNAKTDIFAAGVLFNIMLTGKLPSEDTYPGVFAPVIDKSTQLRPEDRYSSIDEFRKAILHLSQNEKIQVSDEKKHLFSYLPPGYRSGNVFHFLLATFGYVMIFWLGTTLIVEDVTTDILFIERIFFTLAMLLIIFFSYNYQNIHRFFPLCSSQRKIIRLTAIFFFDFIIFLTMICLMLLAESFM